MAIQPRHKTQDPYRGEAVLSADKLTIAALCADSFSKVTPKGVLLSFHASRLRPPLTACTPQIVSIRTL